MACLQRCLVVAWLVPHETAAVLAHILCTPYNHAPVYSVTSFQAIYVAYMCSLPPALLAEWHWDLLHAAVLTQGWNRYWDESQRRKCTLEKKMFMPHLPELEPATFQSWVWCSTTMPSPLPSVPLLNPRQHVQLFPHTCMHHHEITFAVLPTILAASFLQLQRCGYQ